MQKEIFKDIPGYEGMYQVSNLGNVKSLSRKVFRKCNSFVITKEKNLKISVDTNGYCRVVLSKNNNLKTYKIHQLVAMSFLNHTPCGFKLVIDHINDIKTDNRLENLQIVTSRFNCKKNQTNYSSQYKGVCWDNSRSRWKAEIKINGKKIHLGRFKSEYEAHLAYQNKLKSL